MIIKLLGQFNNIDDAETAASRINKIFVCKSIRILFSNITREKPLIFYKEKDYKIPEKGKDAFAFNGVYNKFYSSVNKKELKEINFKTDTNPDFEMRSSKSCVLEICADYYKINNIERTLRNCGAYNITFSGI